MNRTKRFAGTLILALVGAAALYASFCSPPAFFSADGLWRWDVTCRLVGVFFLLTAAGNFYLILKEKTK